MNHADHPIYDAAERGKLSKVQRLVTKNLSLIERRNYCRKTSLILAAWYGHAAVVEWLVDHAGANLEAQDGDGCTGLYWSSWWGHLDVVSILVDRGADINRRNHHGDLPLIEAAEIKGM